jgi:hypothetical protein
MNQVEAPINAIAEAQASERVTRGLPKGAAGSATPVDAVWPVASSDCVALSRPFKGSKSGATNVGCSAIEAAPTDVPRVLSLSRNCTARRNAANHSSMLAKRELGARDSAWAKNASRWRKPGAKSESAGTGSEQIRAIASPT